MKLAILGCAAAFANADDTSDIYAQTPSTIKGCECTSACTTSLLFECNTEPLCSVKDKDCTLGTADYSLSFGYYDYCTFDPYVKYEDLDAKQKQALVMKHVNADTSSGTYPNPLSLLTGILGESVRTSFEASADVFPPFQDKRIKYIHTVGVTGGIKFTSAGGHPYTGLFEGADNGILRLSSAKQPAAGGGTAPGMGVKFFRDGRPSANFVAMYSLDGQPCSDNDFFQHDWNNHIALTDNFALKIIAAKFWQASYCPLQVGLSDLATTVEHGENGEKDVKQGVFPYKLNFHSLVKSDCDCANYAQCLQNLIKNLPVGTDLFEVRAQAEPHSTDMDLIGTFTVTEAFTTSKFGDEDLFFKHQHMESDFDLKPDWLSSIDRKAECGMSCTGTQPPKIEDGCSSPFNNTAEFSTKMLHDDISVVV